MTSYRLINGGNLYTSPYASPCATPCNNNNNDDCTATKLIVDKIYASVHDRLYMNVNSTLSNVLMVASNVDYLNTVTLIANSEFTTNEKQIELTKYLTTTRIPGAISNLGPPYGFDRLLTETLGGICITQNKYKQLNGKSILIEKYFNGTSKDTLFTGASMGKIELVMIVSSMIKQNIAWYNGATKVQLSMLTTVAEIVDGTDIVDSGLLPGILNLRVIDFIQLKTGLPYQSGLLYFMRKEPGSPPFITNYYLVWNITINYTNLYAANPVNIALYTQALYDAGTIIAVANTINPPGYGSEAMQAYFAGIYTTHKDASYFPNAATYGINLSNGPAAMAAAEEFLINNLNPIPFNVSIRAFTDAMKSDTNTYALGYLLNLLSFVLPEIIENPIEPFFGTYFKQNVIEGQATKPDCLFEYDFETFHLLSWLIQITLCKCIRDKNSISDPKLETEFSKTEFYTPVDTHDLDTVYEDIRLDGDEHLFGSPTKQKTVELLRNNIRGYFQRHIMLPAGVGRNNQNCILQSGPSGCIYYDYNRFTMPDLTKIGALILKDLHLMGWNGNNAEGFTTDNCEATQVMDGYHLYNVITMCNADIPGDTPHYKHDIQSLFAITMYLAPLSQTSEDPIFPAFLSVSNNMPIMSNGMWVVNKNGTGFTNNNMSSYLVTNASDFDSRNPYFNFEAQRLEWHGSAGQLLYLDPEHDMCTVVLNIPFTPRSSASDQTYYQSKKDTAHFVRLDYNTLADIDLYQPSPYEGMSNTAFAFNVTDITKYIVYTTSNLVPDINAYILGFDKNALLALTYNNSELNQFSAYLTDNTISVNEDGFDSYPLLSGTDSTFYQMVNPLNGVAPTGGFPVFATLINYFNDVIYPKIITIIL